TLSLGNAPAGVTGSFDPAGPTGTSSTLTVSVAAAVAPGVYNLTVDGTATPGNRSTPLTLTVNSSGGGSSFLAIALATVGDHTCGLTSAGAAYCWGWNNFGQLGTGSHTNSTTPVPVAGGLTFSTLAAGSAHTCGLTSAGPAYCWGGDNYGQRGNGSTAVNEGIVTAVAGTGGLTFSALAAGAVHTCGVTSAGAAYCWGSNFDGQLGTGSTTDSPIPVLVSGALQFSALAAGGSHTCGLTSSGAAYCWGSNASGQLGNGSITNSSTPVAVSG